MLYVVGNAVLSRAAVPAQTSVERSRSQGSAVSQGATAKETEVDVPEMSEKGTCLKGKPNGVFPLPDSDSYADSYSDSDENGYNNNVQKCFQ